MNHTAKIRFRLLVGISGALLSFAGDLFLGWMVYPETGNFYTALIAGCALLSDLRLGLGGFLGALGIPLSFFGFSAIGMLIGESSPKHAKWIQAGSYAMAFWGAAVHLLCAALMFLVKTEGGISVTAPSLLEMVPEHILAFACCLVLPVTLLLLVPYTIACVLIFVNVAAGRTPLPGWLCIFNPLLCKIIINMLSNTGANNCLFNGIHMSNMSFGALLTFGAVFLALKRRGYFAPPTGADRV